MARIHSLTASAISGAVLGVLALAGCSAIGSDEPGPSSSSGTVTLVTHDSFALSDGILADFEKQTGLKVEVVQPGDGGTLANQLVLTKDAPLGDLTFGIDNTFASRVVDEGVVAKSSNPDAFEGALVPVDYGDVCINVDHTWFASPDLAEPVTLED